MRRLLMIALALALPLSAGSRPGRENGDVYTRLRETGGYFYRRMPGRVSPLRSA